MSVEGHIEALRRKHALIEKSIEEMEARAFYEPAEMSALKREKLAVRDELTRLERGAAELERAGR